MTGLLDFLQTPAGAGLLSGIGSYATGARRGTPVNNVGRGVLGGLLGYQQANATGREDEQKKLENEFRQLQTGKIKQDMQAETESRNMYKEIGAMMNPPKIPATPDSTRFNTPLDFNQPLPQAPMLTGGLDGFASQPQPPRTDFSISSVPGQPERPGVVDQQAIKARYAQSPEGAKLALANMFKEDTPIKLGKDERLFEPKTFRQLVGGAPEKIDYNKPFLPDGTPNTAFQEYSMNNSRAGASRNSQIVNPALDPFKNEQALRKEYQDNPFVKSSAEMGNAFRTIKAAYERPSAANDLAMATKYMKLLDPTSVVRESEFALAVNATGVMDKVYNYAHMIKTGEKLNPTQRKDFFDSAGAINDAFQNESNKVSRTYQGIASQYGLGPNNVTLGEVPPDKVTNKEASKPQKKVDGGLNSAEQTELDQLRKRFRK